FRRRTATIQFHRRIASTNHARSVMRLIPLPTPEAISVPPSKSHNQPVRVKRTAVRGLLPASPRKLTWDPVCSPIFVARCQLGGEITDHGLFTREQPPAVKCRIRSARPCHCSLAGETW